jgi:O-antigen/teichoic acid export membrane protein
VSRALTPGRRRRRWRRATAATSWRRPEWADNPLPVTERVFELAFLGLLLGYLLFDRGFAWLHVPGTPVFIGETVFALGMLMVITTRVRMGSVAHASTPLVILLLFMLWGLVRGVPGIPTYGFDALRDLAMSYYGLAAWFVALLLIGREQRLWHWLELYGRAIPWVVVWLLPALLLQDIFDARPPFVPDGGVSVFAHKIGSLADHATLGLLYFWLIRRDEHVMDPRWRTALTSLIVVTVCVAAIINRGSFVSVAAGVAVLWFLDGRRTGAVVGRIVAIGLTLLIVALVFDVRLPAFSNEREVSAQQFVANALSVVDPTGANQDLSGTADWRLQYWQTMIADVTENYPIAGLGPGVNLRIRYGEQDEEPPARDAHNSHVAIYARLGLIGLALWILLWWTWFAHMLKVRRSALMTGEVRRAGLAGWLIAAEVMILVNAIFDPTLEGPQVAIWTWALFGVGAILKVRKRSRPSMPRPRTAADTPRMNGARTRALVRAGRGDHDHVRASASEPEGGDPELSASIFEPATGALRVRAPAGDATGTEWGPPQVGAISSRAPRRKGRLRILSGGVIDAGFASLATFVIGLAASRTLSPADLGVYAIFFTAFLTGTVIPAQLVYVPAEVIGVSFPVGERTRLLRRTLVISHWAALASAGTILFATAAAFRIASLETILALTLTCMVAAYLSPIQDHVRRVLIKDDRPWRAAAISMTQFTTIAVAVGALILLSVPEAWVPFGGLAIANTVSLCAGLVIARFPSLERLPTQMTFRSLSSAGRWLVLSQLVPTGATFLAATMVTYLAGADAAGYAEAARIAGQPLLVLGFGLGAVFEPRFMERAGRRDLESARRVRWVFQGLMALSGLGYLAVAGWDWFLNPMAYLVPEAYTVSGLAAFTIIANLANGATYAGQAEMTGGRRERPLARIHSVCSVALLVAAGTAPVTRAFARPLGVLLQGVTRLAWYRLALQRMYASPPTMAAPSDTVMQMAVAGQPEPD